MKLSKTTCDRLMVLAFMILTGVIIFLCFEISQAWQNERFLDATINSHTTTKTNMTK